MGGHPVDGHSNVHRQAEIFLPGGATAEGAAFQSSTRRIIEIFASPHVAAEHRRHISTENPAIANALGLDAAVVRKQDMTLTEMENLSRQTSFLQASQDSPHTPRKSTFFSTVMGADSVKASPVRPIAKFEPVLLVSIMGARDLPIVPDHRYV